MQFESLIRLIFAKDIYCQFIPYLQRLWSLAFKSGSTVKWASSGREDSSIFVAGRSFLPARNQPTINNVCLGQQQSYPRQIKSYVGALSVYMSPCIIRVQTCAAVSSWQVFNVFCQDVKKYLKEVTTLTNAVWAMLCQRKSSQNWKIVPFLETSLKNYKLPENCITSDAK